MTRKGVVRVAYPAALAALALGAPACSNYFDALVSNPCGHAIEVAFGSGEEAATVEAESSRRFADVLADVGRSQTVEVLLPDGDVHEVSVPAEEDPVPVVVPARICR